MGFEEYHLQKEILEALKKLHYDTQTLVQTQLIPELLNEHDCIVSARTGSGKTAAYAIPVIEKIEWDQRYPQALVLAPTRELSMQIKEEFDHISAYKRLHTVSIFGKYPYAYQVQDLKQRLHVIVGTPGRIYDHLQNETMDLSHIRYVIIDEADEMLDMGFIETVKKILTFVPDDVTYCLCSATISQEILGMVEGMSDDTKYIQVDHELVHDALHHYGYFVENDDKFSFLLKLLAHEKIDACMIFARTQERVSELTKALYDLGLCVDMLHGGMLQEDRIENMQDFKSGKLRILVSSDVGSRGIDVEGVSHIINYDFPTETNRYIHRIGRSARKNHEGVAITLISHQDQYYKDKLEDYLGYPLEIHDCDEILNHENYLKDIEYLKYVEKIKENKGKEVHANIMKLYLNKGKDKKIRAGDIVGAICAIDGVEASDIGVITIQDHQSYVDILNDKGEIVLKALDNQTIKGKRLRVQKAKG